MSYCRWLEMALKRKRLKEDVEFEVDDHLRLDSRFTIYLYLMLELTFLLDFILRYFIYIWFFILSYLMLVMRPKYICPLAKGVRILYIGKIITNYNSEILNTINKYQSSMRST